MGVIRIRTPTDCTFLFNQGACGADYIDIKMDKSTSRIEGMGRKAKMSLLTVRKNIAPSPETEGHIRRATN